MAIRERIGRALLGGEIERLESSFKLLREAYLDGPWQLPPEQLVSQLAEYDSAILYDLVAQLEYEVIGGLASEYSANTEAQRKRAIDESRHLWRYSPLAQWTIWLWTNYGMGEQIQVQPEDENAVGVWDEFWTADRNQCLLGEDQVHELSNWLLVDGNLFLVFFADKLEGETTVREIPCDEVVEIIVHPEDKKVPLFYKRQYVAGASSKTLYYPDWRALFSGELEKMVADPRTGEERPLADAVLPQGAKRADLEREQTEVCVLHIAYNRKVKDSLWGWPLLGTAAPYHRSFQQFLRDRLTVAAAKAMYVRKAKIQGGSRGVDAVKAKLQSALASSSTYIDTNPPAPAGSTLIENQAVTTSDMPLTTGAADAKTDSEMFSWMALIAGGVFPHYAGQGDAYRLATASAMEGPILRQWSRYQLFWSSQLRRMVKIVLSFHERANGKESFKSQGAEISTDRLVEVDLEAITKSVSQLFRDTLNPYAEMGIVDEEVILPLLARVWLIALQALGVSDTDKLIQDGAFTRGEPEEEEGDEDLDMAESHLPEIVSQQCPLCGAGEALSYPDHKGLLVCGSCHKTFDPAVE